MVASPLWLLASRSNRHPCVCFMGYPPFPAVDISSMSALSSGLCSTSWGRKGGCRLPRTQDREAQGSLVKLTGPPLVQSHPPASAPDCGLLPRAQMGMFLPGPLSTLVSLKRSLQSLTVTRKLLPMANLNPSPPVHSRHPALFWGRWGRGGAPLFAVWCGVKRADTASALSVAGSSASSPQ